MGLNRVFFGGRHNTPLIAALLLLTALPQLSLAALITVTSPGDDANPANGTCTLREAIRAANTNAAVDACTAGQAAFTDTVQLPAGTYTLNLSAGANEDASLTGDLDVLESINIVGVSPEHTVINGVQSQSIDRVLDIHASATQVTLSGLTVMGGDAVGTVSPLGGNLRIRGNTAVVLIDAIISDGRAASGGGIENAGDLTLYRTGISDNTAVDTAATNNGGSIENTGSLRLEDSYINGNNAAELAGGIHSTGLGSQLVMFRSRVTGNTATLAGGGIYAGGPFEIRYSQIEGNSAGSGGGIYMAEVGEITHSAIVNNTASLLGGAVYDDAGSFVRYSTLSGNTAPNGSAVYCNTGQTLLDSDTIAANTGSAVFNQAGAFFENTLIAANTGGNCSGAAPAHGAYNLENANSCEFINDPANDKPNFPNTNPLLGPLADNGGPTPTMALNAGSPAINAVSSLIRINCEQVLDQRGRPRGRPRIADGPLDEFRCDIGAYERVPAFVVNASGDQVDASPGDDICRTTGGTCTLRAAVQQANANIGLDEITLPSGNFGLTLGGSGEDLAASGDLDLTDPVIIRGAGTMATVVNGNALDRVFDVRGTTGGLPNRPEPQLYSFSQLTIRGGAVADTGGAIRSVKPLSISRVTIAANSSNTGAGVYCGNDCAAHISDSTFESNTTTGNGGGVFQGGSGVPHGFVDIARSTFRQNSAGIGGGGEASYLRLRNSTVSENDAGSSAAFFANAAIIENSTIVGNTVPFMFGDSGAFFLLEQSVIGNSIIAGNTVNGLADNCSYNPDAIVSLGFNLTDTNATDCLLDAATDLTLTAPMVGTLAANGGVTATMKPLPGSPAIDAGNDVTCPDTDQRGLVRPQDGNGDAIVHCDIGAFEVAASGMDFDADGVADSVDNCPLRANPSQIDADSDGMGNACDADINNDCLVNFADLAALKAAFNPNPYNPRADFNSDGLVNFGDLAFMKSTFFNSLAPGPGPGLPGNLCE